MRPDDRGEFVRLMEMLCSGFNVPSTDLRAEAYWRGLQRMDIAIFARCVERALGERGPEKMPTVPQVWNIYRDIKTKPALDVRQEPSIYDGIHAFGQRYMLRFLMRDGPVSDSALARLIQAKNRIIGQFREIRRDDPSVTADEVRSALDRVFSAEMKDAPNGGLSIGASPWGFAQRGSPAR
jgi:hypothetical protein